MTFSPRMVLGLLFCLPLLAGCAGERPNNPEPNSPDYAGEARVPAWANTAT